VNPNTPYDDSAVDEYLEKLERVALRSKILEEITELLLSVGIDAEELYSQVDNGDFATVVDQLPTLFCICCMTKEERDRLKSLYERLRETEP
jgi:hypothetical protein